MASRSITLRLPDDALQLAPLDALERLARAIGIETGRRDNESKGAYRGRLRHAIQRAEAHGVAGRRWLIDATS